MRAPPAAARARLGGLGVSLALASTYAVTAAVAAVVFVLAYDGGSYNLASRNVLAVAVWWLVGVLLAVRLLPRAHVPREALVLGALLTAFALFTLASVGWADSAEDAVSEFNRVSLYLGVFALTVLATTARDAGRWSDGLALGIAAIALVALVSRFFQDVFPEGELVEFLPSARARLSFPLGYWNGLAIFTALAIPLLLRAALVSGLTVWRAAAVGVLPALVSAIYLTSSRGGAAAAVLGTIAFVALTERRWAAATAVSLATVGSAAAIFVLATRSELVNDPSLEAAESQGATAAALIALVCLLTGVAYALAAPRVPTTLRVPRAVTIGTAVCALVLLVAAVVMVDPAARFEAFKQPPQLGGTESDFVQRHLLSVNGSGRWQQWTAAVDEFESSPVIGRGAGSYESWWLQHGTSAGGFARDAHSLYVEVLGELGVIGFLLLAAFLIAALVVAGRRLMRADGDPRVTLAALTASFLAFAAAAGIDWMWEFTIVTVVALACLGLVAGPATAAADAPARRAPADPYRWRPGRGWRRPAAALALAACAVFAVTEAVPLLAHVKISSSEAAVERSDLARAAADARDARELTPWASSPYLQLALVAEQAGEIGLARRWIREAIERDRSNWQLWVVAARVDVKAGSLAAARRNLERAIELNPRSPLFAR